MHIHYSMKHLVLSALILFIVSIGYSTYANSLVLTSKTLCAELQSKGFIKNVLEGSPWTFEVMRHETEFEFEPVSSEIFKCYTVSDGYTHVPCMFKGAIKQFANQKDFTAGLAQIRHQNYQKHLQTDLNANVTRANTTLEHYIFYKSTTSHLLVILPVTDTMSSLLKTIEALGLVEVDE